MNRILKRKLSTSGFTLLEIMVAMGLIAITLVTVIQLQSHNIDLQSEAQMISMANFLATATLSQIQASESFQIGSVSGDFGEDHPSFRYKQDIESVADMEDLYNVTVTIYPDAQESEKSFVFNTYIYRKNK